MSLRMRVRSGLLAAALAATLWILLGPPPLDAAPIDPLFCPDAPDGTLCSGNDPDPTDCLVSICLAGKCVDGQPSPDPLPCKDTDGNLCTVARCTPTKGTCDQNVPADPVVVCGDDGNVCTRPTCDPKTGRCQEVPQGDGKPCGSGELPEFCPGGTCREGTCVPSGEGGEAPASDLAVNVQVVARPERVTENEAFNDCCVFCAHQSLEALRPSPTGPQRFEVDGGLPMRRKLCGSLAGDGIGYGVNDERDDPRDILLNLEPGAGFEDFTAGTLQNACSKMTDADKDEFRKSDSDCPLGQCAAAAAAAVTDPARQPRCVHSEVTPAQQFYGQDRLFLPIDDSGPCSNSPSKDCDSQLEDPSAGIGDVCVYGVYSFDHGEDHRAADHQALCCLPDGFFQEDGHDYVEIHPFDSVWWRHPKHDGWMFGVFQDDSNRYSFPHCGSQNNGNQWSQAPRDITFRFPFSFPRSEAPLQACVRYVHTEKFNGTAHEVSPINVSTAFVDDPLVEAKKLNDGTGILLEVVEPPGREPETQIRIDGCAVERQVKGFITLRVAVGCSSEMGCFGLDDPGDPGSGFFYGELVLAKDCSAL